MQVSLKDSEDGFSLASDLTSLILLTTVLLGTLLTQIRFYQDIPLSELFKPFRFIFYVIYPFLDGSMGTVFQPEASGYNFFLKAKIVYSMQPIKFLLLSMFIYPWPAPIWSCSSVVKQWKSNVIMESVALHFTLWWSIQKVDELKHSIMLYFCVSISNALLILILGILVLGEDGTCISKRSVSKTVKTCCKMLPSSFWQC